MTCVSSDTLAAYRDGELSPVASDSLALHLDQCERCRAILARLEADADFIKSKMVELDPSDVVVPKFEKLPIGNQSGQWMDFPRLAFASYRPMISRWLRSVAAAVILVAVVVILTLHESGPVTSKSDYLLNGERSSGELNPNEAWHDRRLVVTLVNLEKGTREKIITSVHSEDIIIETLDTETSSPL